jgi:serine/threonine-protein kinase
METGSVSRDVGLEHLEQLLSSATFRGADRSTALLRFLVEQTVDGHADRLKEYTVGAEGLGRGQGFDPRTDPIVRAEASRLRSRLERYYATEGLTDALVIALPKGSYVPQFQPRNGSAAVEHAPVHGDAVAPTDSTRPYRHRQLARVTAIAIAAAGVFATGLWLGNRDGRPDDALSQFEVELRSDGSLGSEVGADVVISHDGTRLAYVTLGRDGVARLSTRRLQDSEPTILAGTDGARGPFFSPDGRSIGFLAAGKLKKVPVEGGSPVVLCDATDLLGASWDEDGTIVATLNSKSALWRVPAGGGVPSPIAGFSKDGLSPRWPQILPGGTHVMYTAIRGFEADRGTIEVMSLRDGTRKILARGGTFGRYLAPGFFSYVNQGTLYVAPFDLRKLETRGPAVPVLDGISYSPTFGYAQIDISPTGTVVCRKSAGDGRVVAAWLDSTGATQPLVDAPGRYTTPRLSADGRRFAMSVVDGGIQGIAFYEQKGGRATRLPATAAQHGGALWTPDSRFVVMNGATGLWWSRADDDTAQPLIRSDAIQAPWSFTPNGDRLAYYEMNPASAFDLWTVPVRWDERGPHAGTPELYLRTPAYEVYPSFSPDGRWLAYASTEAGISEVYVRHFPDNGTKVQVSKGGGRIPRWSRNGHDLLFGTDAQRMMAARYSIRGDSFVAQVPRLWTHVRLADTGVLPNYDLAPDGARIIALMPAPTAVSAQSENHVTVMLHFIDELRRRAAAAGAR